MRPEQYDPESLIGLLRQRKIATIDDLKEALGTRADATVFRKLGQLDYRTSYSHRGRYYTLAEIARFDELGLWSFRQVWFSRFGTSVSTVEALVVASEAGYDGRSWRRCCTWRPRRLCLAWCGPGDYPVSGCPGAMCTCRHSRRPVVPSWRPGRSMTPRPEPLVPGPGTAGPSR